MLNSLKLLIFLLLIVLVAVFAASNRDVVEFSFYPLPFKGLIPKYLVILFLITFGILLGMAFSFSRGISKKLEIRKLRKKVEALQNQIDGSKVEKEYQVMKQTAEPLPEFLQTNNI